MILVCYISFVMRIGSILLLLTLYFSSLAQEKLLNVNGINYNVWLKGFENRQEHAPAIIFENGMGSGLHTWDKVMEQVSAFAPVFAYDRAGIGKSDRTFKMPTANLVAEDLHRILKTMKISPPYLLVGHSLG